MPAKVIVRLVAAAAFVLAGLLLAGCSGGLDLTPEPFTRERADGKIPVKTELIRQQVRAELSGMPEGEAEVRRWQAIEADYHSCRLSSSKAKTAQEQAFADCMANRGYVDMHRLDAGQDSDVWLDTYRFGALTRVNDEVRLYAGVDSYNNAIFAIDAQGDNMHRLGFAAGEGYAVKYEYQVRL